jgi:hypothetical protein
MVRSEILRKIDKVFKDLEIITKELKWVLGE